MSRELTELVPENVEHQKWKCDCRPDLQLISFVFRQLQEKKNQLIKKKYS